MGLKRVARIGRERYGVDASYRLNKIGLPAEPNATALTIAYDSSGKVQTQTDAVCKTWTYTITGDQADVADPNGAHTITHFGAQLKPDWSRDANGNQTSYTYDGFQRLLTQTNPELDRQTFAYDGRGNITSIDRAGKPGSVPSDIIASASFDATCGNTKTCNQPNSTTDGRGKTTRYTYDGTHGGLLTETDPSDVSGQNPTTTITYSSLTAFALGADKAAVAPVWVASTRSSIIGDGTSLTTNYGYDDGATSWFHLNQTSVTHDPQGVALKTSTLYDSFGSVGQIDGPQSGTADTTTLTYDHDRRVSSVTEPSVAVIKSEGTAGTASPVTQSIYDDDGRLTTVQRSFGASWAATTTQYADPRGARDRLDRCGRGDDEHRL